MPRAAAQRIVDPTGLTVTGPVPDKPWWPWPPAGYDDTDLDPYHEVAMSFVVRPHDAPRVHPAPTFRELGTSAIGVYIHRLPVDREFSCAAGRDIWGFPKWLASSTSTSLTSASGRPWVGAAVRLVDGATMSLPCRWRPGAAQVAVQCAADLFLPRWGPAPHHLDDLGRR